MVQHSLCFKNRDLSGLSKVIQMLHARVVCPCSVDRYKLPLVLENARPAEEAFRGLEKARVDLAPC